MVRINSIPPKELLAQYVHVRERLAVQTPPSGMDKTELTEKAKAFSLALKTFRESMETRTPEETARLNQIAAQVKNGTYFVPGFRVAGKIMGIPE